MVDTLKLVRWQKEEGERVINIERDARKEIIIYINNYISLPL